MSLVSFHLVLSWELMDQYITWTVVTLLLVPGFVEYAIATITQDVNYDPWLHSSVSIGGYTLVFWSLFACSAFVVYLLCYGFVYLLPLVVEKIAQCVTGQVSSRFDIYMGYISGVRSYFSSTLFMTSFTIVTFVVFRPDQNPGVGGSRGSFALVQTYYFPRALAHSTRLGNPFYSMLPVVSSSRVF